MKLVCDDDWPGTPLDLAEGTFEKVMDAEGVIGQDARQIRQIL